MILLKELALDDVPIVDMEEALSPLYANIYCDVGLYNAFQEYDITCNCSKASN